MISSAALVVTGTVVVAASGSAAPTAFGCTGDNVYGIVLGAPSKTTINLRTGG